MELDACLRPTESILNDDCRFFSFFGLRFPFLLAGDPPSDDASPSSRVTSFISASLPSRAMAPLDAPEQRGARRAARRPGRWETKKPDAT